MSTRIPHPDAVHALLSRGAASLSRVGQAAWRFELVNGKRVRAIGALSGNWLTFTAGVGDGLLACERWDLLRANPTLPGGARYVLDPEGIPRLHVDAWLRAEADADVSDACRALLSASAALASGDGMPRRGMPEPLEDVEPAWMPWLDELSWAFTAQGKGAWRSDHDARGIRWQVEIHALTNAVRCRAVLVPLVPADARCRDALAHALLTAGCVLRFARPGVMAIGGRDAVIVEAVMPLPDGPDDLVTGVEAVATACEQLGPEARALTNGALAAEYLQAARTPTPVSMHA